MPPGRIAINFPMMSSLERLEVLLDFMLMSFSVHLLVVFVKHRFSIYLFDIIDKFKRNKLKLIIFNMSSNLDSVKESLSWYL